MPRLTARHYVKQDNPDERWGKGRGGRPWARLRKRILLRDKYTCQSCHRVGGRLEIDHIVPISQGGTKDESNLQVLCRECHRKKTIEERTKDAVISKRG
jgi:5-methylcytosine-specific restriction protein A